MTKNVLKCLKSTTNKSRLSWNKSQCTFKHAIKWSAVNWGDFLLNRLYLHHRSNDLLFSHGQLTGRQWIRDRWVRAINQLACPQFIAGLARRAFIARTWPHHGSNFLQTLAPHPVLHLQLYKRLPLKDETRKWSCCESNRAEWDGVEFAAAWPIN